MIRAIDGGTHRTPYVAPPSPPRAAAAPKPREANSPAEKEPASRPPAADVRQDLHTTTSTHNGATTVDTTYTQNGTRYNNAVTTDKRAGWSETLDTSTKGALTQTTYTRDETSNEPLSQLAPNVNEKDPNFKPDVKYGPAGPVQVQSTIKSVTDDSQHPPHTTELLAQNTYTQTQPVTGGSIAALSPNGTPAQRQWLQPVSDENEFGGQETATPLDSLQVDGSHFSSKQAGQATFSVTATAMEAGLHVNNETVSSQVSANISGGPHGSERTLSQASTVSYQDGKPTQQNVSWTATGLNKDSDPLQGPGGNAAVGNPWAGRTQYLDRVPQVYTARVTRSNSFGPDGQETGKTQSQEAGSNLDPNQPGSSVTLTQAPFVPPQWSYRKTTPIEAYGVQGVNIRQQVATEGSKGWVAIDSNQFNNGDFNSQTNVYTGNAEKDPISIVSDDPTGTHQLDF